MYRFSPARFTIRAAILPFVAFAAIVWTASPGGAQDSPGPKTAAAAVPFARLLPHDSLVYLHLPNAAEARTEWWQTAVGRMIQDPQFKPLVDQTFAAAERSFEPLREQFGLSLQEWLVLPQGEVGFAIVPVDGADPAAVLFLEAADDDRSIALLLERGRAAATAAGLIEESETVGGARLTIFRTSAGKSREVLYVRRDGKLVLASNRDVVKRVLELWHGEGTETLGDHPPFLSMERLVGRAENAAAHALWYVDPINLVRQATLGNTSMQVGLAVLPALGLDGLTAVGGSMTFNRGPFEVVGQAYLLLDVPRAGVVELIALRPTSTVAEPWVFDALSSYNTLSWDVERTYHQLRKLVDSFRGDGALRRSVQEPLLRETEIDLETEVLAQMTGRLSLIIANEEPFAPESRGVLFGAEFADAKQAEKLVRHMAQRYAERWTTAGYAGTTYYHYTPPQPPAPPPASSTAPSNDAAVITPPRRVRPRPAFCALGKYVLVADRASLIERAVLASGDASQQLANSLDYKLIAAKAKRYTGENGPGLFTFMRPVEDLRFVHGLAANERVREQLAKGAEKNAFLGDFQQALADRPLPPFEVLERYFAPGGAILVDEPTGLRYLTFILKRPDAP